MDRVADIKDKIVSAVGLYGNYAVRSLIEDYEYHIVRAGGTPDTDGFLLKLQFSRTPDGDIHLSSPDVELTWNDTKKKWDGFKGLSAPRQKSPDDVAPPSVFHPDFNRENFTANKNMLRGFPGALEGLRSLFKGIGFVYEGEKIDFATYLGIVDVYLDELNGTRTVTVADPEGDYTWDPGDSSWTAV